MLRVKLFTLLALLTPLALVGCDSAVEGDLTSQPLAAESPVASAVAVPTPQGPDPLNCSGRYAIYWRDANGFLDQYAISTSGNVIVTGTGGGNYAADKWWKYINVATTGGGTATFCTVITGFTGGSSNNCITVDIEGYPCA